MDKDLQRFIVSTGLIWTGIIGLVALAWFMTICLRWIELQVLG